MFEILLLTPFSFSHQEQTDSVKDTLAGIGAKFEETVTELKKTCKAKTAVPVDQVYVCIQNSICAMILIVNANSLSSFDWRTCGRIGRTSYSI